MKLLGIVSYTHHDQALQAYCFRVFELKEVMNRTFLVMSKLKIRLTLILDYPSAAMSDPNGILDNAEKPGSLTILPGGVDDQVARFRSSCPKDKS